MASPIKARKISHVVFNVADVDRSVKFYTEILGFVKKNDVPVGEDRWLTVVSPENCSARRSIVSVCCARSCASCSRTSRSSDNWRSAWAEPVSE